MKNDSLWRLIRAMDPGEMRTCREALERTGSEDGPGHLLLFNTLTHMQVYDNGLFLKEVSAVHAPESIAVPKTRLKDRLLLLLADLHDERRRAGDPVKLLRNARTYTRLGMHSEAAVCLQRGIGKATEQDELLTEVQLRELLRATLKELDPRRHARAINDNEIALETAAKKLKVLVRYELIRDRMLDHFKRKSDLDDATAQRGMRELMRLPEMKNVLEADSVSAQMKFYSTAAMYAEHEGDKDRAMEMQQKLLSLWESRPGKAELHPQYI